MGRVDKLYAFGGLGLAQAALLSVLTQWLIWRSMGLTADIQGFLKRTGALVARPFDRRIVIAGGDRGTAQTIGYMRDFAIRGMRDPIVRLMTLEILDQASVEGRDHRGICEALFEWSQSKREVARQAKTGFKFVNDGLMVERVEEPWLSLCVTGAGDCNSVHATSLAAMLGSVGIGSKFRTIGVDPRRKNQFTHVYTVALPRGKVLAMDTSVPFSSPGYEVERFKIFKSKDWGIDPGDLQEDDWAGSGQSKSGAY